MHQQDLEQTPPLTGRPDESVRRRSGVSSPDVPRLAMVAVLATLVVFLAIRLGPALIGAKVFGAVDLLVTKYPWRNGQVFHGAAILPYVTDNLDSIFPGYLEMHRRFFAGDLPLWSASGGPGAVLMGGPNFPTLTPSAIWLLLFPTSWSLGFTKLVEVLLAFAGMTCWLRRLGTTWAAGGIAGLFYVGSGFMTAWANWTGQASAACLVPALFWAIERLVQLRTTRSALPISGVVAFLLLSGFPAVAGHALYAGGAYFLVRLVGRRRSFSGRSTALTLGYGIAAVALGIGLSAVQLLPQVDSLLGTDLGYRSGQFNSEQPFTSLLSLVLPRTFNTVGYLNSNPIEAYAFLGFGALALAVLALLAGRWSRVPQGVVWMLAITFLLSSALVWEHGFWTDWLQHFPIFSGNNSGRLRDLVALSGCALGGIGANLLFDERLPDHVRRRLALATGGLVVLGALGAVVVAARYRTVVDRALLAQDAALGLAVVVAIGLAFLLMGSARRTTGETGTERATRPGRGATGRPILRSAVLVVLIALIGAQTAISVGYFWPLSDVKNFYPTTPAIATVQNQAGANRVLAVDSFLGSSAEAYGIRTVTGHVFSPTPWRDLINSIYPQAFTAGGQSPTNPGIDLPLTSPRLGGSDGALLDRLAVNTIVADPTLTIPGTLRHRTTGKPVVKGSSLGGDRIPVPVGSSTSVPLKPQNLRGVQVQIATAIPRATESMTIRVTITDAAGKVKAAGSTTRSFYPASALQIPIAGEQLGAVAGPLTLTISAAQLGGPSRILQLASTDSTVGVWLIGSEQDGLTETYADDSATVWARSTALPRVRWAKAAKVLTAPGERLATLANPATPDDLVVLSAPGPSPSGAEAALSLGTDTGDEVQVRVQAQGAGYLVLADSLSSGWHASVNGIDSPIVEADHAFGAVFVPAGTNVVTFTYVGTRLKSGAAITGVSLLIALAVAAGTWWRRRRRPAGSRTSGAGFGGSSADSASAFTRSGSGPGSRPGSGSGPGSGPSAGSGSGSGSGPGARGRRRGSTPVRRRNGSPVGRVAGAAAEPVEGPAKDSPGS